MQEPSEELLDQHYQTQLRKYKNTHRRYACPSDKIVIGNWLRIFGTVPKEQKLARNSLMILMYGHLKEFGFLRDPFVDIANLNKDLNVLLDGYAYLTVTNDNIRRHTYNNVEPSLESVIRYALRNPVNNEQRQIDVKPNWSKDYSRDRKWFKTPTLQPIKELPEISEMEPIRNRYIEKHTKNITYNSHRCNPTRNRYIEKYSKDFTYDSHRYKMPTLQPIEELTEFTEMESTRNRGIEKYSITYNSHRCYKPDVDLKEQRLTQMAAQEEKLKSVRGRIQNYELAIKNDLQQQCKSMTLQSSGSNESDGKFPTISETTNYEEYPQSGGDVSNEATVGISTTTSGYTESSNSRSRAVRSLKVHFDKMGKMIKSFQDQHPKQSTKPYEMCDTAESKPEGETKTQNQRKTQIQPQTTTTRGERVSSIPLQIVMHQECNSHQTEELNCLRKRNRELRKSCLKYYNLDGSLKQRQRSSHFDEMKAKQRTQGFLIGAHQALKRLKRWRGLPQRLGFFATCFGLTGLGLGQWRWSAIDRGLERATRRWYCHTLQHSQEHAWRSYRRVMINKSLPKAAEALRLLTQVLNRRKELILEHMSHLEHLKQLCAQECAGRVNNVQLQQMLTHLEDKYLQLAKGLHSLVYQLSNIHY